MKFPMVITCIVRQFDVSQILVDGGNSCDVMYLELYEKAYLDRASLWPYEGSDLQDFNGTTTHPRGYVEMMVFVGDGKDIRTINS